jgi:hypothetical protein
LKAKWMFGQRGGRESAKPRSQVGSTVALLPNLTHSFADANNQPVF